MDRKESTRYKLQKCVGKRLRQLIKQEVLGLACDAIINGTDLNNDRNDNKDVMLQQIHAAIE